MPRTWAVSHAELLPPLRQMRADDLMLGLAKRVKARILQASTSEVHAPRTATRTHAARGRTSKTHTAGAAHLLLPFVNREQDMTWGRPERRARVKILRSSSTVTSTTAALAISRLKVILDMVAGPYVARDQRCLATDGRLVLIASQGGSDARFDATVAMIRRQVITGSTLRPQSVEAKNQLAEGLRRDIWPLLNNGSIAPVIAATFPLDQAAEAHRMMESGELIGKIVLTTQEP